MKDSVKKGSPPTLFDRIATPVFLLVFGTGAILWFIYQLFLLLNKGPSPVVTFDKGSCYMLGVGVGLLALAYMVIKEFWLNTPLTNEQTTFFSRIAISGVVLAFIFPHLAHFTAHQYLKKGGYAVCEEASHQWLFIRDIVYIQPTIECSRSLKG